MNLRDFRIGWRLLLQQPAYSAVVIGGLAIGFAACFLLFGFVEFCLNFNSAIPDNDRVLIVKQRINVFPRPEWQAWAFLPLRDVALASGMVSQASVAKPIESPMRAGSDLRALNLLAVDPDFRTMFGIVALQGDLGAALAQPDGVALTRSGAQKLFGDNPAVGQTVRVDGTVLQVRALMPDPPANSSQQYEALVGTGSSAWPERETAISNWGRGIVYMKLKPGASMPALTALLQEASEKAPANQRVKNSAMGKGLNGRNVADISLLPLHDAYFDEGLANSRAGEQYGQRSSVFGLAAAGFLILLLAAINYINLATVRTLRRQREIGIRKLLGASSARLVRQFLSEAALTSVLATIAGLVLAWLLLPTFAELVNRPLAGMFTPTRCRDLRSRDAATAKPPPACGCGACSPCCSFPARWRCRRRRWRSAGRRISPPMPRRDSIPRTCWCWTCRPMRKASREPPPSWNNWPGCRALKACRPFRRRWAATA